MNVVDLKGVCIGEGRPKTIVPITAGTLDELLSEIDAMHGQRFDIAEWRVDLFADFPDENKFMSACKVVSEKLADKPVIFTYRTKTEGGKGDISVNEYINLINKIISSSLFELIDVELSAADAGIKDILKLAHENGCYVILSSHDFMNTPAEDAIIAKLCKMQRLGGDILKIAVMPESSLDVLTLLSAATKMISKYATKPVICISMGELGLISRYACQQFGSAATFGVIGGSSAPGQPDINKLNTVLDILSSS